MNRSSSEDEDARPGYRRETRSRRLGWKGEAATEEELEAGTGWTGAAVDEGMDADDDEEEAEGEAVGISTGTGATVLGAAAAALEEAAATDAASPLADAAALPFCLPVTALCLLLLFCPPLCFWFNRTMMAPPTGTMKFLSMLEMTASTLPPLRTAVLSMEQMRELWIPYALLTR